MDWNRIYSYYKSERAIRPGDLLLSPDFYALIQEAYQERYSYVPFTDVFWTLRSMYMTLFSLLSENYPEADVYHAVSTGYAGLVASYAANTKKAKLLVTEHGIYTREREEEIIKSDWVDVQFKDMWIQYFRRLSDSIYASADRVLTLFEKNRGLQIELGCPADKIRVIHNGVSKERFQDYMGKKEVTGKPVCIASILRVVPIKDVKTLLQAFAIAVKELPSAEFLIVGPTDENPAYYEECVQYMKFLELERVRFTGRIDVRDVMNDIDIHVLSSISEGQPLAVMETMLCSIPNVTTNVEDCEALRYGEADNFGRAGSVVGVMDYEGLAREIVELANNPEKRMRMGEAGQKRILTHYGHEQFIESYRSLYQEMEEEPWQG